jgi:hypothetical protein
VTSHRIRVETYEVLVPKITDRLLVLMIELDGMVVNGALDEDDGLTRDELDDEALEGLAVRVLDTETLDTVETLTKLDEEILEEDADLVKEIDELDDETLDEEDTLMEEEILDEEVAVGVFENELGVGVLINWAPQMDRLGIGLPKALFRLQIPP